jgi:hypothetical protein
MNKRCVGAALLAVLGLALVGGTPARADEKKDTKDKDAPKVAETEEELALATLLTAHELAAYGRRTKTAEALATAALMIAKTPFGAAETPKDKPEGAVVKAYDPQEAANALLAEAKKIDPKGKAVAEIAAQVADLHKERPRGRVSETIASGVSFYTAEGIEKLSTYKVANLTLPAGSAPITQHVTITSFPTGSYSGARQQVTPSITNHGQRPWY